MKKEYTNPKAELIELSEDVLTGNAKVGGESGNIEGGDILP